MQTLFEFLPIGAYRSTASGVMLHANAALVHINGYDNEAELLAGINHVDSAWYVDPGRRAQFRALMERDGHVINFVSQIYRHKTREHLWVREAAHVVRNDQGEILYYEGTLEDITASHQTQLDLATSEQRLKLALESTGDGVWDWYVQTGDEFFSKQCKAIFGFAEDEISDRASALDDRTHPDDVEQMRCDREAHFRGETPAYRNEHRVQCKDGTWKWVLTRGMVISRDPSGLPLRMIGTHTDITARKEVETLIWHQASFDPMTGLPNRRMLRQQLEDDIVRSQRLGQTMAIVFIDLDHFKEVNDTLGHQSGDLLLVQAAQRVSACIGPLDKVARMGGDEFTLVVSDVQDAPQLAALLQSILDSLSSAFQLKTEQIFISASMGVAMYPNDALLSEDLFKHADQALYVAKTGGRNRFSFFTPALQEAAQTRLRLASDLRLALGLQQFSLVYQPIVDMRSDRVFKAEALLRWHHPQRGLVSPGQFIGIAESTGLILDIGEWVFRQSAQQVKHWRGLYGDDFQISVNKSPVQFHRNACDSEPWIAHLQALGLPGSSIAIEITEGVLLDSSTAVSQQLLAFRNAGIAVSLDDFGTGYSSLTYLQRLAIDFVKIDQSFVRNLTTGSTDLALCKAIIVMAHELGMQVVAEGVETALQRDLLMQAGCDFGQGYLYAKPLTVDDFEIFMRGKTNEPLAHEAP